MTGILWGFAASTLRVSTPLIFAALAGLLCERSGVVNIALEGIILVGAFFAAVGALHFHSPWTGALSAGAAGAAFAGVFAYFVLKLRAQPIVAGIAMNILAVGLTPFWCKMLYDATGTTPALSVDSRFTSAPIALAWLAVILLTLWLRGHVSGLRVRFAGENPDVLSANGVSVLRVRFLSVVAGGFLAGLGGASLSIFLSSSFSRNMTSGRGFIALAALILGRWRPVPVACACLLFGFTEALQTRLQGLDFPNGQPIPVQLIQIMPYVVTLFVMAGALGKSSPPAGLGR